MSYVLVRCIGGLAIATRQLHTLTEQVKSDEHQNWCDAALYLERASVAIIDSAGQPAAYGNTIVVSQEGVLVPLGESHIDALTAKIIRHIQVGRALGVNDSPHEIVDETPAGRRSSLSAGSAVGG